MGLELIGLGLIGRWADTSRVSLSDADADEACFDAYLPLVFDASVGIDKSGAATGTEATSGTLSLLPDCNANRGPLAQPAQPINPAKSTVRDVINRGIMPSRLALSSCSILRTDADSASSNGPSGIDGFRA